MALWKPFRGDRTNLDTVEKHDGYIYFCIDDGSLFFDYTDASGILQRKQITVQEAEKLLTPIDVTIGKKTVSVDGSNDVSFPLYEIMGSIETPSSGTTNKGKWGKFAIINLPSAWNVCSGILNFAKTEGSYGAEGILSYYFRNGSSTSTTDISLSWISLNNEAWVESVAAVQVSNGKFALYYKPVKDYETVLVTAINIYSPSYLTFGTDNYVSTITAEAISAVRSYAKSANSATMLQTYKPGSTTETYGEQYPLMAQWEDSDTLRLYSEDSVVKVDYAEQAGNVPTTEEITTIVDARINANKPKITTIALSASAWTGSSNPWSQSIDVSGATENSKLDLQPTAVQIVALQDSEITLMLQNDGGNVSAWAIGNKPTEDYTMQVLITEVQEVVA